MIFKISIDDDILANDHDIASLLYQHSGYLGVMEWGYWVTRGLLGEVIKVLKLIFPTICLTIFYNYFYTLFNTFKNILQIH